MDRIRPIRQPGFEKLKVNNCREKRCSQRVLKINMRKSYHASRITDRSRSYRRENRSDLLQKQQHGDYDVTETLEAWLWRPGAVTDHNRPYSKQCNVIRARNTVNNACRHLPPIELRQQLVQKSPFPRGPRAFRRRAGSVGTPGRARHALGNRRGRRWGAVVCRRATLALGRRRAVVSAPFARIARERLRSWLAVLGVNRRAARRDACRAYDRRGQFATGRGARETNIYRGCFAELDSKHENPSDLSGFSDQHVNGKNSANVIHKTEASVRSFCCSYRAETTRLSQGLSSADFEFTCKLLAAYLSHNIFDLMVNAKKFFLGSTGTRCCLLNGLTMFKVCIKQL